MTLFLKFYLYRWKATITNNHIKHIEVSTATAATIFQQTTETFLIYKKLISILPTTCYSQMVQLMFNCLMKPIKPPIANKPRADRSTAKSRQGGTRKLGGFIHSRLFKVTKLHLHSSTASQPTESQRDHLSRSQASIRDVSAVLLCIMCVVWLIWKRARIQF